MSHHSSKAPSQRQLKVGEEIRHLLSDIFMRGDLYTKKGHTLMVTVSEVRVSPDLRNATVYMMPLGGKNKEKTLNMLQELAPAIRHQLGLQMRTRHTPVLFFKLDGSFDEADKITQLIHAE